MLFDQLLTLPALETLFTTPLGEPIRQKPLDMWGRWRRDVRWDRKARMRVPITPALGKPRAHDLRLSHASMMIAAAGMDLMTLQDRLGHESIRTTVDRYGHVMPGTQAAAARAASEAMAKIPGLGPKD